MDPTNMEGVEGDAVGILQECVDAVLEAYYEDHDGMITRDVKRVLSVLRSRHLLTPEAIEQLKKEGL